MFLSVVRVFAMQCLAALAMLQAGLAVAQADEPSSVRIGYTQSPPFSGSGTGGVAEGYAIDGLRYLLGSQGYAIRFLAFDNPEELRDGFAAGEIDLTAFLLPNADWSGLGTASDPFQAMDLDLIVREDDDRIATLNDLTGLRVGVVRGSLVADIARDVAAPVIVIYPTHEDTILPLLRGDLDAVAAPTPIAESLIATSDLTDRLHLSEVTLGAGDAVFFARPDRPQLLADLNAALSQARAQGTLDQLAHRWFTGTQPPSRIYTGAVRLLVGLLALALLGSLWVGWRARRLKRQTESFHAVLQRTGAAYMVLDAQFQPIWWNEVYERSYLIELPLLRSPGPVTLHDLIVETLLSSPSGSQMPRGEARAEADRQIAMLKAGQEIKSIGRGSSGRALVRRTLPLPAQQYAVIATDISDIATDQDKMREEVDRLIAANEQMEKFSQKVAHNLVGPVSSQANLLGLLREDIARLGVDVPPETMEIFEEMETSLGHQRRMVADLLEWSLVQHSVVLEDFKPMDRLTAAVAMAALPAEFSLSLPETLPRLHGNPITFEMILRNLLSNAKKHHDRARGTIKVNCDLEGDDAVFRVIDDGPGIPSEYLDAVFAPFHSLKSKEDGAGTGLGLALVRESVEAWGGTVRAVDTRGQRGTCIRFTIPRAKEPRSNVITLGTAKP